MKAVILTSKLKKTTYYITKYFKTHCRDYNVLNKLVSSIINNLDEILWNDYTSYDFYLELVKNKSKIKNLETFLFYNLYFILKDKKFMEAFNQSLPQKFFDIMFNWTKFEKKFGNIIDMYEVNDVMFDACKYYFPYYRIIKENFIVVDDLSEHFESQVIKLKTKKI